MFKRQVPLKLYSNYKIGGAAHYFYEPKNQDQIIRALEKWDSDKIFILGGGTNILFNDDGFDGLVLKPAVKILRKENDRVVVGAGVEIGELLDFCVSHSLAGLEWAGGLPGTIGGAVRGNAGAFGGEIKDVIEEVISIDFSKRPLKIVRRTGRQCRFKYRDSVFKSGKTAGKELILKVILRLQLGDRKKIQQIIDEKIQWRQLRQPLDYPNIGSIFKNVPVTDVDFKQKMVKADNIEKHIKQDPFPVVPAATFIDKCGLKGVSCGGAMIAQKHPNFIVNALDAKAQEVKALILLVKNEVYNRYGVRLEEEVLTL